MAGKAKASIDLGAFNVQLAGGKKSKSSKPDQLTIESPKLEIDNPNYNSSKKASASNPAKVEIPVVDKCIELAQAIENLETEQKILEGNIIDSASTAKVNAAEDDDNFVKTINVSGTSLKIQIQFRDAYSKMEASMEQPLTQIFGDKYPIMFKKETNYSLRDGKIDELKKLLGDRFDAFFDTDTSIKPTENFQQTFFTLRKTFKPEQLEVIDKVKAATMSKPAVKYPK